MQSKYWPVDLELKDEIEANKFNKNIFGIIISYNKQEAEKASLHYSCFFEKILLIYYSENDIEPLSEYATNKNEYCLVFDNESIVSDRIRAIVDIFDPKESAIVCVSENLCSFKSYLNRKVLIHWYSSKHAFKWLEDKCAIIRVLEDSGTLPSNEYIVFDYVNEKSSYEAFIKVNKGNGVVYQPELKFSFGGMGTETVLVNDKNKCMCIPSKWRGFKVRAAPYFEGICVDSVICIMSEKVFFF